MDLSDEYVSYLEKLAREYWPESSWERVSVEILGLGKDALYRFFGKERLTTDTVLRRLCRELGEPYPVIVIAGHPDLAAWYKMGEWLRREDPSAFAAHLALLRAHAREPKNPQ